MNGGIAGSDSRGILVLLILGDEVLHVRLGLGELGDFISTSES